MSAERSLREMMSLDGRVALVTGGAGHIGRAVANGLAELGANIAIADIAAPGARGGGRGAGRELSGEGRGIRLRFRAAGGGQGVAAAGARKIRPHRYHRQLRGVRRHQRARRLGGAVRTAIAGDLAARARGQPDRAVHPGAGGGRGSRGLRSWQRDQHLLDLRARGTGLAALRGHHAWAIPPPMPQARAG